jgi:hypothetical protein
MSKGDSKVTKILRDRHGKELGRLVVQGQKTLLRDRSGAQLGTYTESDDTTRNRQGSVVGRGNLLTTLLTE